MLLSSTMESADKRRISVRFRIDPVEIGVETEAPLGQIASTVESIVKEIGDNQEQIAKIISAFDRSKFHAVEQLMGEHADPLERIATRLKVHVDKLTQLFLIENEKVYPTFERTQLGARGAGEKAALAMLYVYKYGLEKSPSYDDFNEGYEKLRLKPLTFGARVKGNLLRNPKKIIEKDDMISIEPTSVAQAEAIIRSLLPKD